MLAIGLMSGTSVDGLDIALVDISGVGVNTKVKLIDYELYKYSKTFKQKIFKAFNGNLTSRYLCSLNFEIGYIFANAVNKFLKKRNISNKKINFIASHGQTIYHLNDPSKNELYSTLQLGDISVIANNTKITCIGDFRNADVSVNGNGAPLVAYPDYLLFRDKNKIRLLQNIGGIANVTVVSYKQEDVIAFDNGCGNVLIDFCTKHFFNKNYDLNGFLAFKGKVNDDLIAYLKNDNYYDLKPPKTTGREKYSFAFFNKIIKKFDFLNPIDIVSSLTYFTALIIKESYLKFIFKKSQKYEVYLSGGGANNLYLVKTLKSMLNTISVENISKLGINIDAKEAIEFVILGNQTLHKQYGNLKKATNAKQNVILGKIAYVK